MRHIVCFSGGESSAIVAEAVVRRYGKSNVTLLNHDINPNVEDADVKRFKAEVAAALGMVITQANYRGLPAAELPDQFDISIQSSGFKAPGTGDALCTNRLKTAPFAAYLAAHHPPGTAVIYYGFDDDEQHRIARRRMILGAQGYATCYPLAEWPDALDSISEIGIAPPLGYSTYRHANCAGCLKGGMQHWYVTYCHRPDLFAKASGTEQRLGYAILSKEIPNPSANACPTCHGSGFVELVRTATPVDEQLAPMGEEVELDDLLDTCPDCRWAPRVKAPLFLADLAPVFARMKCAGVPDTEHYPEHKFKRYLKQYRLPEISLFAPCECAA